MILDSIRGKSSGLWDLAGWNWPGALGFRKQGCSKDEGGIGDAVLIRVLGTNFRKPDKGRRSTGNQETESSRTLVLGIAG